MQKIILYYIFIPLADPEAIMLWQRRLCGELSLRGRILISAKGLNGTLGGEVADLKAYIRDTREHPALKNIEFKWSDGSCEDFPKLSVKVRSETVTLGLPQEVEVDERGIIGGGERIMPENLDEFVRANPDAVFFDGRNAYESAIGKFKNAVTPDVQTFKELPAELDKPEYAPLKSKKLITYCTGGIRCEPLSALMKKKGFEHVYQLHGGVVKYGEVRGDGGLWEGKCFVFDRRMSVAFSGRSKDIGVCEHCAAPTSNYQNCAVKTCNKLMLLCEACRTRSQTCSHAGQETSAHSES